MQGGFGKVPLGKFLPAVQFRKSRSGLRSGYCVTSNGVLVFGTTSGVGHPKYSTGVSAPFLTCLYKSPSTSEHKANGNLYAASTFSYTWTFIFWHLPSSFLNNRSAALRSSSSRSPTLSFPIHSSKEVRVGKFDDYALDPTLPLALEGDPVLALLIQVAC